MLTSFIEFINLYGYKAILVLITLENIFPPIPCELILTFSGFLTTISNLDPPGVIIVATLGSYLGAVILYFCGYLIDYNRLISFLTNKLHFNNRSVYRSINWFDQYGKIIVFLGRLIPIIRSLISIPAGITKMNFFNFSIYTIIGSLIWNAVLVYFGIFLGDNWQLISFYLQRYSIIIVFILIIIFIVKKVRT